VIVLATGTAERSPSLSAFRDALADVCARLAEMIVRDGEGAKKVVHLRVTGARTDADALGVARSVADSVLFRTAIAGGDPNWGRVLAAMGAGSVRFEPDRVAVSFGGVTVCRFGVGASFDPGQAAVALRGPNVHVTVDLGIGSAEVRFLTCDLTHDYVTINAEYTT
jgi:glutamate N-acetyltransferase / amino-acid N-acetyltransferase